MTGMKTARFDLHVLVALLAVYVCWGGTYLGIKFAIETIPPFLMAGTRFVSAGIILYIIETLRGAAQPNAVHWKNAAIVGGLMLLGGNGGVVWAEQTIPSGIAAIIVATVPLWLVILAWLWQGEQRPNRTVLTGLLLGFSGTILLVQGSGSISGGASSYLMGYIVLILAALSWAVGSLYSRKALFPASPFMATAMQMIMGGLLCMAAGLMAGEAKVLDVSQISLRSFLSLGYLISFGSIIGFTAYIWLLKMADTALVATYAYVNPVVALALGWLIGNEAIGFVTLLASFIILAAVVIITRNNANSARSKEAIKPKQALATRVSGLDGEGI